MRESSFGMFRGNVGVASLPMLNGLVQMLNPFGQMRVFASPLSKVQRLFRMCHEHLSMTLFAMGHRFLRLRDGIPDVTGWGRLGVQHGHTNERAKRKQNEGTTVEFARHLSLPFMVRITAEKTVGNLTSILT